MAERNNLNGFINDLKTIFGEHDKDIQTLQKVTLELWGNQNCLSSQSTTRRYLRFFNKLNTVTYNGTIIKYLKIRFTGFSAISSLKSEDIVQRSDIGTSLTLPSDAQTQIVLQGCLAECCIYECYQVSRKTSQKNHSKYLHLK
jgi:hypothetical protein